MSSSIPNAVPAFMAIAAAALPSGFQVRIGTVFGPYMAPQALLVTSVHVDVDEYAEMGPNYRHEEHYSIQATLCSTAGNDDHPARLSEVYGLYQSLSVAVATQPTLNGTVRLAWTRQLGYTPGADAKGLQVGALDFEVQCQARVTSLS